MKAFVNSVVCLLVAVLLTACNIETLYSIKALNDRYCAEKNADTRKMLIDIIHRKLPGYPEEGLCGIENVIAERIA